MGHASVVLLANEANDHYESFIAPRLLIFLDQIGIENVGFGEKERKLVKTKKKGGVGGCVRRYEQNFRPNCNLTRFARKRVCAGRVYAKMVRSFGVCVCAYL